MPLSKEQTVKHYSRGRIKLMVDCSSSTSTGEGLASKTIEICNACSLNFHVTNYSGYDTKLIESKLHFCASLSVVI